MELLRFFAKRKQDSTIFGIFRTLMDAQNDHEQEQKRKQKKLAKINKDFNRQVDRDPRARELKKVTQSQDIRRAITELSRVWSESSAITYIQEKPPGQLTRRHYTQIDRSPVILLNPISNSQLRMNVDEVDNLDTDSLTLKTIYEAVSNGFAYFFAQKVSTYTTFSSAPLIKRNLVATEEGSFVFRISWQNGQVLFTLEQLNDQKQAIQTISSADKMSVAVPIANAIFHKNALLLFELPLDREKRKRS